MEKLKPCPFCGSPFMGGVRINSRYRKGTANRLMYWISCNRCHITQFYGNAFGYRTIDRAIAAWNHRVERSEE